MLLRRCLGRYRQLQVKVEGSRVGRPGSRTEGHRGEERRAELKVENDLSTSANHSSGSATGKISVSQAHRELKFTVAEMKKRLPSGKRSRSKAASQHRPDRVLMTYQIHTRYRECLSLLTGCVFDRLVSCSLFAATVCYCLTHHSSLLKEKEDKVGEERGKEMMGKED
ncbi:unnamed protein product [Pleuronectes platessa]|uniref:Period circadian protein homolog PER 1-3 bHLH-like domain-containing protein n=1 Tax=Pleuronectes platessa TaxID=8262 RepID=A0A9N7VY89_PLEPL|nr:unnamed protein product [Pleuronectes platessa]